MSETTTLPTRAKKGVGLSGVTAGNTALCTVGRSGNDLHYRGYDILDFADSSEFEEIAYLLVHGKLPTRPNLPATRRSSRRCADCPSPSRPRWRHCQRASHPMDVMRTGSPRWAACCRRRTIRTRRARATLPIG